jgi:hypothetical protein
MMKMKAMQAPPGRFNRESSSLTATLNQPSTPTKT